MVSVVEPGRNPSEVPASSALVDGYVTGSEPIDVPYCDEELRLIALPPHNTAIHFFRYTLKALSERRGLAYLSDNPVTYVHPTEELERIYAPDVGLAREHDRSATNASDLCLVLEVVSTQDKRKELKDTVFNRALNEWNGVPEFGLFFPDRWDSRCFQLFSLDPSTGEYVEIQESTGGWVSAAIPGLVFRRLPKSEWRDGLKLEVLENGIPIPNPEKTQVAYHNALRVAEAAKQAESEATRRAEQEKQRAEQEKQRAEQEKQRAERLAAKLRAAGIDPEG
ncbi:MAG: Uma2 family endonuclease [Deltaproteobacteria bacterium]|nr:Uma2 family endonuclease [Deltaproteobacteria bacterium]